MTENDIIIEQEDVKIISGDFAIQSANNQNIKHIEVAEAGNFYITPTLGVGIYKLQNSSVNDYRGFTSKTTKELTKDGYTGVEVAGTYDLSTENTEVTITAVRNREPDRQTISEIEDLTTDSSDYVRSAQSLYDFAIWKYGTVEAIAKLVRDNDLKYDSDVYQGQELVYSTNTGNEDVKQFYERKKIIPVSNIDNLKVDIAYLFEDNNGVLFEDDNGYIFE